MQNIREIASLDTYTVRHPILRKGKPISTCQFEGDDLTTTFHFGYFVENELIGIISLFKTAHNLFDQKNQYQIRGMAVIEKHRNKGIAKSLVFYCEDFCKKLNCNFIWLNARTSAISFYEKLEYQKQGKLFEITNAGEHILMSKKDL